MNGMDMDTFILKTGTPIMAIGKTTSKKVKGFIYGTETAGGCWKVLGKTDLCVVPVCTLLPVGKGLWARVSLLCL
jgi:hypothetical protein